MGVNGSVRIHMERSLIRDLFCWYRIIVWERAIFFRLFLLPYPAWAPLKRGDQVFAISNARVINDAMDVVENRPPTPESNVYDARYLWLNSGLFFVVTVMHWSFKRMGCFVVIVDIIFSISMVVPDVYNNK